MKVYAQWTLLGYNLVMYDYQLFSNDFQILMNVLLILMAVLTSAPILSDHIHVVAELVIDWLPINAPVKVHYKA